MRKPVTILMCSIVLMIAGIDPEKAAEPSAASEDRSGNPAANSQRGKLIFSDDFSNPDSGWERERDVDYIMDYVDGEYQIKNISDRQISRGMYETRESSDGDFSVTARKISGPEDIRFGLVTRYTGQAFLEASITPDGRCSLWVPVYEGYTLKNKPEFKPCAAVRRTERNHLRLVVAGNHATFYVNGEKVAELDQIGQNAGRFGLFGTSTSSSSEVRFDDFELR